MHGRFMTGRCHVRYEFAFSAGWVKGSHPLRHVPKLEVRWALFLHLAPSVAPKSTHLGYKCRPCPYYFLPHFPSLNCLSKIPVFQSVTCHYVNLKQQDSSDISSVNFQYLRKNTTEPSTARTASRPTVIIPPARACELDRPIPRHPYWSIEQLRSSAK